MASAIIKRTNSSPVDDEESVQTASSSAKRDAVTSNLAGVSAKVEDGNISAAVRIPCSDDVIADYSAETLAKLQLKHPGEHASQHSASSWRRRRPQSDSLVSSRAHQGWGPMA